MYSIPSTMDLTIILPVLAISLLIALISIKLFYKIRVKLPKIVNCWFCNKNTRVPYVYRNSWKCPNCDQYNGFTPDGDYNRILLAQHNVNLNKPPCLKSPTKLRPSMNGLCQFCNINQELKVAQLAAFVPVEPTNFDEEVEIYREQLDKAYHLCVKCENVLSHTLSTQKSWLQNLYTDLENFLKHKSVINNQIKLRNFVFAYLTAMISLGVILCASSHFKLSLEIKNSTISYVQLLISKYPIQQFVNLPDIPVNLGITIQAYSWMSVVNCLILLNGLNTLVQLLDAVEKQEVSAQLNVAVWFILFVLSVISDHSFVLFAVVEMLAGGVNLVSSMSQIRALKLIKLQAPLINYKSSLEKPVHTVQHLSDTKTIKTNSKPYSPAAARSVSTKSLPSRTPPHDFGLGKLNLGSNRNRHKTNSLFEPKTYGTKIQSQLFRPVLTPPKLSLDSMYEAQTPSSSSSSGFFSSGSQRCSRPPSIVDDFDSHDVCSLRSYPQSSYNTPYEPMYPTSPYIFTQYHRMYHPVPTTPVLDTSFSTNNSDSRSKNTLTLPMIFVIPITLSFLTNIALVWLELYKQFVS